MAITLKRQLNDDEKQQVLAVHGRRCFATGHEIPDGSPLHFDHIRAFAEGGATEINNIAPMCETHNKAKGTLPLEDFRVKLRLDEFFAGGDRVTLKHLLEYLKQKGDLTCYGTPVSVNASNHKVEIQAPDATLTYDLYTCPATGWEYFYATLPIALLDSDDEEDGKAGLQPRYLIPDKVFELYRHFQTHPVLQPSIGRVHENRLLLFDGQHKIAALLWTNRRDFECKVYLAPDIRRLNETNIAAHDKYSQMRFFSSIMLMKLGSEFGSEFDDYKKLEDGKTKSEVGFMHFLEADKSRAMTRAERNRRFRSYLMNAVLEDEDSKTRAYISSGQRSTDEKPLTIDLLTKSVFQWFLHTDPVSDDMTTAAYKRDQERVNNVALLNMLYEQALCSWDPRAGAADGNQLKLRRLFGSKSMMAWSELLRDAVCASLHLLDEEDRRRPFYRDISDEDMGHIRQLVQRLVSWNRWSAPQGDEIDRVLPDSKSKVKEWFKGKGLTTGYLLGAE
ncbi:HNH endonuclease [bacterium]|nr:HNH endonuclease [bacterium]